MASKKEVVKSSGRHVSQPAKLILPDQSHSLILVKSLSKSYRKRLVLKDVDFEVEPGDIFGLIGMSGSGKTTMFQLMSGILKPDAGDVLIKSSTLFDPKKTKKSLPDYVSVYKNQTNVKKNFGFAAQIPSFYEHLTVEENMLMYGSLYGMKTKDTRENMSRLLRLVGLHDELDSIASELSGGMQRRLDIACSLIHNPKVLFLDEPTSDLDPLMRKQIWSLLKEINSKGTTIVLASHILEEVENLCNKVAILHDKKVLGYGTLKELKRVFKRNRIVRIEFDSGDYRSIMKKLKREKGIIKIVEEKEGLVVTVPDDDKLIRRMIRAVESSRDRLVNLDVSDSTLNDIFETLAGKRE